MSKFVTYPAVTVLDNDQSLLIDDPNAGTNSITAENAADTLLSKWAGFETFDEAVQNTISNNQEFIDRDTAIRSETAELKKKIVTTFPAKEASGAVAAFESEFEDAPLKSCIVRVEPVQDLHGYDSPWPAGGGKNLFDVNEAITFPTTQDGITFNVVDSVVILNGTAKAEIGVNALETSVEDNTTYTASVTGITANTKVAVLGYKSGSLVGNIGMLNSSSPSLTFDTNTTYDIVKARPTALNGATLSDVELRIQIEKGSIATDWSPYSNICPISGWTGCEVQRTGKNLLDVADDDNAMTRATSALLNSAVLGVKFEEGKQYTFSIYTQALEESLTAKVWYARFRYSDGTSDWYGKAEINNNATASGQVMTRYTNISKPGKTVIGIQFSQGTNYGISYKDVQLELGSTATDYEPYQGETYPITFPAEAGTVYGGYVDVINGELVVDRAMINLGGWNWIKYSVSQGNLFRTPSVVNAVLQYDGLNIICSNYPTVKASQRQDKTMSISSVNRVDIIDSNYSDASAFKTAMNGVQLVYELAEPIHYPLTPTEIKTLLGQNNIWADTGDTEVEYLMSDVSWYVEKKLRAFQSILAGVEDSSTASKNYSANTYLIFNDDIYKTTKAITAGETIEEGVNVTKTTVAEQLLALAQA